MTTDRSPVTTAQLRAGLAAMLRAHGNCGSRLEQEAADLAAELLAAPDQDPAARLAVQLGDVLDAHLGRLQATGAVPQAVALETAPVDGWPSYVQVYRWAYAALVELARLEIEAANVSRAMPADWPAGQAWEGLGSTSRSTFLELARERVGVSSAAFLRVVRSGLVDVEDLWEGTAELPDPRPGLVVHLEGEDRPRVVSRVVGSRVELEDGTFLDWPDLVEDAGHPWPPFARPQDLAELEGRRSTAAEDAEDLAGAVARLKGGGPLAVISAAPHLWDTGEIPAEEGKAETLAEAQAARVAWCPTCKAETDRADEDRCCLTCGTDLVILADRHSAELLAELLEDSAAVKALDEIAALSGCATWDYPGQVVRDVKAIKAKAGAELAQELRERARYVQAEATGRAPEVNREIAAELEVVAGRLEGMAEIHRAGHLGASLDLALALAPSSTARARLVNAPTAELQALPGPVAMLEAWAKRQDLTTARQALEALEVDPSLLGRDELAAIAVLATGRA